MTLRLRDLTEDERAEVQRITRSHRLGVAFVRRAQIVVHAMSGLKAEEIASRMDLCGNTVRYWINRYTAGTPISVADETLPGFLTTSHDEQVSLSPGFVSAGQHSGRCGATNTHTGLTINCLNERQPMAAATNIQLLTADEAQFVATFRRLALDRPKGDLCAAELCVMRCRIETAMLALVT